jgi:TonB-dependent starch-binding outer membrane protein SusC
MFNLNLKIMKKKPNPGLSLGKRAMLKRLLMTKLFLLFFSVGIMNASAGLFSQSSMLTIDLRDKSAKEVLKEVENNSSYRFLYNDDFTDLEKLHTIRVETLRVEDLLDKLFADSRIS